MPKLSVEMSCDSVQGRKREANEDAAFSFQASDLPASPVEALAVLGVASGMGGAGAGDAACHAARDFIESVFVRDGSVQFARRHGIAPGDCTALVTEVFHECNRAIARAAIEARRRGVMGTTLALGVIAYQKEEDKTYLFVGNVGNNRGYILRGDQIFHATEEDSNAWRLYKKGAITYSELLTHPERSVITVLGIDESVAPEVHSIELHAGDTVLFCTDGVHEMVDDETIGRIIRKEGGVRKACAGVLRQALSASKKKDNAAAAMAMLQAPDIPAQKAPAAASRVRYRAIGMPLRTKIGIAVWAFAAVLAAAALGMYFFMPHEEPVAHKAALLPLDTLERKPEQEPVVRPVAVPETPKPAIEEAAEKKQTPAAIQSNPILSVEWNEETERFRIRSSVASIVPVRLRYDTFTFDLVPVKSVPNLYRSTRALRASFLTQGKTVVITLAGSDRPVSVGFTRTE